MGVIKIVPFSKSECCGCSACVYACPVSAINMQEDEEGFLYPSVNYVICTSCGLCSRNCAFLNKELISKKDNLPDAFVVKHLDQNVRMNSRSGGVFVALSDWIIDRGGVVYGCVLDENLNALHIRATNKIDRNRMCRSKYVQSDTRKIFSLIRNDLKENRLVLFSGTGCETDSVLSFLQHEHIETTNLFLMDIICHGVPSPKIFSDFIGWMEREFHGKVTEFEFRDKSKSGWDGYIETAKINNKNHSGTIYRELFQSDLCLRPSCYNCKYSTVFRTSDITIGDAWGIKKALPQFNDNRGVSLIIINSKKGKKILEIINEVSEVKPVNLAEMLQKNLYKPTNPPGNRDHFWNVYKKGGIDLIIEKFGYLPFLNRLSKRLKYFLRKVTKTKDFYLP